MNRYERLNQERKMVDMKKRVAAYCRVSTDKADQLKNSKAYIESTYYDWLLEALSHQEQQEFAQLLDRIYQRSKDESRENFTNVIQRLDSEKV